MLTAAVDPLKGLFVQQAHQPVLGGHVLHGLHGQLVVVRRNICRGEDGGQLVLGRSHFVVLRLGQNPQLPQLLIQILHKLCHPGLDGAKVVVVQLLALGSFGAEQRSAAEPQVRALLIELFVHQEVLLLRAHSGDDALAFGVSKQP